MLHNIRATIAGCKLGSHWNCDSQKMWTCDVLHTFVHCFLVMEAAPGKLSTDVGCAQLDGDGNHGMAQTWASGISLCGRQLPWTKITSDVTVSQRPPWSLGFLGSLWVQINEFESEFIYFLKRVLQTHWWRLMEADGGMLVFIIQLGCPQGSVQLVQAQANILAVEDATGSNWLHYTSLAVGHCQWSSLVVLPMVTMISHSGLIFGVQNYEKSLPHTY